MALKALLLKKELDGKRKSLGQMETRSAEFETRAAELAAAIEELTDDATDEQRAAVSESIDALDAEKAEHEGKVSQLREEIAALEKELEEAEKDQVVPVDTKPEERKNETMITRDSKEYIEAYAEYIRGNKDARELRNMITTENDTTPNGTATVPVPSFVYDVVKTAWEKDGIMALVRKAYIRGNLKIGFEISGTDAVIHEEGSAAISPEDLVLGIVELVPQSIKKVVQVSDEALDMGGEAFLRYIYDELTYRIAKKAAAVLLAAIQAAPATSTKTAPAVAAIAQAPALGTVASAVALLSDEAANPVVVMNKATYAEFKTVQYAASYAVDPFEGLNVVFDNSIKAYSVASSGEAYMIVGDFGYGALANFPSGDEIEIKLDRLTLKKQDLVEVLGRKYVGIGITAPNAFVKVTKA